jgi:hypothetical protein
MSRDNFTTCRRRDSCVGQLSSKNESRQTSLKLRSIPTNSFTYFQKPMDGIGCNRVFTTTGELLEMVDILVTVIETAI